MEQELKDISENNSLDWYTNKENIKNQTLVSGTIDYFENGERKNLFHPLDFLNLLWKQFYFVLGNHRDTELVIKSLKELPLDDERKHVLLGFIIYWYGGYPVHNLNDELNKTLKEIEKMFLSYNQDTPEKEFCRRSIEDSERELEEQSAAIIIQDYVNKLIGKKDEKRLGKKDEKRLWNRYVNKGNQKKYSSFSELYEARDSGIINDNDFENETEAHILFNRWLHSKGHDVWDERADEYEQCLTMNMFSDFVADFIKCRETEPDPKTGDKSKRFARVFTGTEQKKLFGGLTDNGFLPKETIYSHLCYVFGGTPIPDNEKPFKPLQWTGSIKELHYFISKHLPKEANQWEKAVGCFLWNSKPIKKSSLTTAMDKYDKPPDSSTIIDSLI
jgi:hypothetical protein